MCVHVRVRVRACVCACSECNCTHMSCHGVVFNYYSYFYSKLLQKQLVTAKFNPQQVVKEVTAAVTSSQQAPQTNEELESDDEDEFGAASTYANYLPAKCKPLQYVTYTQCIFN